MPQITAPAWRAWATTIASGRLPRRNVSRPDEAGMPSTSKVSLMVIGRPASGPSASPRERRSSIARARSLARSRSIATTALIAGLTAWQRERLASSSSSAPMRPASSAAS